ncbi:bacterial regulatory protein, lacI family protein [Asticcacaulis biprosthecium C19]|uniref:Bacterial regulatory protein, lacI family protein n=1 Tax=Asticcacaulis biprosthecium C19 TaxID=715226 RepID=F4QGI9_9CAUL|nr:LacI family DNA-binding transcriptional regulator [Asticcacaulis biprosthecium]EGF93670.1 bacterial regulatory protein, lacI family protein [Asticcacaulis biprosthecium C19]
MSYMKRQPTCIDVAATAGVSQATVSRVLNKSSLVKDSTRDRVLKAAEVLKYKIDNNARFLRSSRVRTLALLILEDMEEQHSDINPFFLPIVGSIVRYAADRGYEVMISLQRESNAWGAGYCLSRPAEGIIFLGSKNFDTYAENFRSHNQKDDNWVVWGLDKVENGKICVASDNSSGAYDAVNHLIASGRRRIAYIGKTDTDHWEFLERYDGYGSALSDAGIAADPALVVDSQLKIDDGAEAVRRLLDAGTKFDAIFASTDILGLGAMRELMSRGYKIPEDVSVIGFDDLWVCNIAWPRLSSVRQDTEAAARRLVDSVCALIEGEPAQSVRIPTQLVLRESCSS